VLRVTVRFSTEGEVATQVAPGDEDQFAYSLLYGIDDPILSPSVEFGSATITVTSSANHPVDVSEDESRSATDTLSVIEHNQVTDVPSDDGIGIDNNGDRAIAAIGSSNQHSSVSDEQEHDAAIAEVMGDEDEEDQYLLEVLNLHWMLVALVSHDA
jgi:hypothetical protein